MLTCWHIFCTPGSHSHPIHILFNRKKTRKSQNLSNLLAIYNLAISIQFWAMLTFLTTFYVKICKKENVEFFHIPSVLNLWLLPLNWPSSEKCQPNRRPSHPPAIPTGSASRRSTLPVAKCPYSWNSNVNQKTKNSIVNPDIWQNQHVCIFFFRNIKHVTMSTVEQF